ncbi:hypothetical protein CMI37_30095 [Candidatus Pacearchaeota archaeon]|nr:hypothetical protein [Candidatus Pacearchaeota archaeon]|tara:strand:- start:13948 stop:14442 length:495 start_codon:yes stop_codon:yes gene_type:complete
MKKTITELIRKYNDLGLVTPVTYMTQRGQVRSITKHLQRSAVLWDCIDRLSNKPSDSMAELIIRKEKMMVSRLLYKMTKKILVNNGLAKELKPDVEEEEFMKDHEGMFEYCIEKLLALRIITPFLRAYYSPLEDEEGVLFGAKQVAEEDVEKGDSEQFDEEGMV